MADSWYATPHVIPCPLSCASMFLQQSSRASWATRVLELDLLHATMLDGTLHILLTPNMLHCLKTLAAASAPTAVVYCGTCSWRPPFLPHVHPAAKAELVEPLCREPGVFTQGKTCMCLVCTNTSCGAMLRSYQLDVQACAAIHTASVHCMA